MNLMSEKTQSYLIHFAGGVLIVIVPLLIAGIPESAQAMTIGGVLGMLLKFVHDIGGY